MRLGRNKWVQDCWYENYNSAPEDGSKAWEAEGGDDCSYRVIRGGSWYVKPRYVRSAYRLWSEPGYRDFRRGFRLAQDLD